MGLKYYSKRNYAPVSSLLRQARIKTENQLMAFSDSSWQDFLDTGRSTGAYIIFYQGRIIDHGTHVLVPVAQPREESEYNAACTTGMALEHFRVLIYELLNKDTYIVLEEVPIIILDNESPVCMSNNGKDSKQTSHISSRMHFVRNGEKYKMHKIDWCEGGLQLEYIVTNNVGEHYLTTRMKYTMVRLDN